MPTIPARLILFLSSYSPLFVIIAVRGWQDNWRLALALAIVAGLSVVVLFVFLRHAQTLAAGKIIVSSITSRDGDAMSYIVTYLLPFLGVHLNDATDGALSVSCCL